MNRKIFLTFLLILLLSLALYAQDEAQVFRIGMIGLDTGHAVQYTKYINDPEKNYNCKVVAGFPMGSPDIEGSIKNMGKYVKQLREEYDVEIVNSMEELCEMVDGVLVESIDGRPHLEQARAAIVAKKPVFIDKPMAASLEDVIEIFRQAEKYGVPCWSTSPWRFSPEVYGFRNNEKIGKVVGCDGFSPCPLEEHHPDLYWYGIHGVEPLYTVMGTGCKTVQRIHTENTDFIVGVWQDGRIGTVRGTRQGRSGKGVMVYGKKGMAPPSADTFGLAHEAKSHLIDEIVNFFNTGKVPVPAEETIEIFAFMSAADESKKLDGKPVSVSNVIEKAKKNNKKRAQKMGWW